MLPGASLSDWSFMVHHYTEAGNLKAALRRLVVTWVLEAWTEISKGIIIHIYSKDVL